MPWRDETAYPVVPNTIISSIYFSPIINSSVYIVDWGTGGGGGVGELYLYNIQTHSYGVRLAAPTLSCQNCICTLASSPDETRLAMISDRHGQPGYPVGQRIEIYNIAGNSWTNSAVVPMQGGWGGVTEIMSLVWSDNDTIWAWLRNFGSTITRCVQYIVSTDTWNVFANTLAAWAPRSNAVNAAGTAIYGLGGAARQNLCRYVIGTDTYTDLGSIGGNLRAMYSYDQDKLWFAHTGGAATYRLGYVNIADLSVNTNYFEEDTERSAGQPTSIGVGNNMSAVIANSLANTPWLRKAGGVLPWVQTDPATEVT